MVDGKRKCFGFETILEPIKTWGRNVGSSIGKFCTRDGIQIGIRIGRFNTVLVRILRTY